MLWLWAWYCPQNIRNINKDKLLFTVYHIILCWCTSIFSPVLQPHVLMHMSYIYYCSYTSICAFIQCDMNHLERGVRTVQSRKWPQATGWMIEGLIPGRCKRCFLQPSTQALQPPPPLHPSQLLVNGCWKLFPQGQGSHGMRLTTHHHLLPPLKRFVAIRL
jgi:hypothetical protein